MATASVVVVASALLAVLPAQQMTEQEWVEATKPQLAQVAQAFLCQFLDRHEVPELPEDGVRVPNRLVTVLDGVISNGVRSGRMLQVVKSARGQLIFARVAPPDMAMLKEVFAQLQKEKPVRARLQCTVVTMPWSVAKEHVKKHRLEAVVDEDAAGELVRDAVKSKGSLRNLPEIVAVPLAPFHVDAGGKPAHAKSPQLRGEMVPLADNEVALAMHLVRGALPADKTQAPGNALMKPVFRLRAGKAGVALANDGETATALVVRCVEIAPEAPAPVGK